ncbi:hypothetical protein [Actinomadura sp. K4S16]|uniref:hypothetical protein n=1 Tax=Actinomadura sp. K4S16 TaxID=1316147 RepID=UPI0011EF9E6D|nr:hypothetical protein [Actinomadura sp. K4S16]
MAVENESRDENVTSVNPQAWPQGVRMDVEIAAIVLAVAGSTVTASALAAIVFLVSCLIRTLCAGRLRVFRGSPPESGS